VKFNIRPSVDHPAQVQASDRSAPASRRTTSSRLVVVYYAFGVPIGAGALYPVFGLLLSPIFSGATMASSPVSVVTNALRLRRARL
jgi:cation transport ATPase